MKIVLIFRPKNILGNSIEVLFNNISEELSKASDVVQYVLQDRKHILSDIINLRKLKADVYHITGDCHYLAMLLPKQKTILTIHDINHYLYDLSGWRKTIYKFLWITQPIKSVAKVTTISDTTKNILLQSVSCEEYRICVIPNCFSVELHSSPKLFNQNNPVILQVGTSSHKNVSRVISAIKNIKCKLVLIGRLSSEIIIQLKNNNIIYDNYVGLSYDRLIEEYINCDIVMFVSLREGFGVPIIEAQAIGRPIITSNIDPMRRIAGGGAFLADPMSIDSINKAILSVINDEGRRKMILNKAKDNIHIYSVQSIAKLYYQLYLDVVERTK